MWFYHCFTTTLIVAVISISPSFAAASSGQAGICPEVPKNYSDDVKCYRYAAERGDRYAQNNLGFICAEGKDVTQNLIEAYAWWTAAAMNGIETARVNMDRIRHKMSANQIERAQFLAMECFMRTSK